MNINVLREFFHFTRKGREGITALLCVIFILMVIQIALPYLMKDRQAVDPAREAEIEQVLDPQEDKGEESAIKELKPFDPNKAGFEELTEMGIPAKVASNWVKYLEKGGHFGKASDISKIYGMTPELFNRLEGFARIPKGVNRQQVRNDEAVAGRSRSGGERKAFSVDHSSAVVVAVELNMADSAALESLPGIGTILAPRIIRYRNLLGGFYSVEQLREVYGLSEEHFKAASPHLFINGETFARFNLNFASARELGRHPYVGFRTARKIVKLRDERGKYFSAEDLSEIMTADSIARLTPYLKFDE